MGLSTRRKTRVAIVLLAAVAAAAAYDGMRLMQAMRWNETIASGQIPADLEGAPRQVSFARAYALSAAPPASAASSAAEAALHGYRSLQDDTPLGQAARYNSANLLMRQAVVVRASSQPGQAITLIELAKEMYRDVLRVDPQHWAARYNLERAQRLLADPEEAESLPVGPERNAERAATTMRGYSPGLP